jgi:hypothetical protein
MSLIDEFYPTPSRAIAMMVHQQPIHSRMYLGSILDPSAGKGDILDYLVNNGKAFYRDITPDNLYAIEIIPELQIVLAGKGYRVIGDDFLAFNEPYQFNVILMNPPWSNGADHALQAWNYVAPGGALACILNVETIHNPYSAPRRDLCTLIERYGYTVDIGAIFKEAERRTDAEAILIVLEKPEADTDFLKDIHFDTEAGASENVDIPDNALARADWIQALVDRYNAAISVIEQRHKLTKQLWMYMDGIWTSGQQESISEPLNAQINRVKEAYWLYVFEKTLVSDKATSVFKKNFETIRSQQSNMAFTYKNVVTVLETILQNFDEMMKQCIVNVFDEITRYHKKNIVYHEGWVTNKAHRIAKKIIHPRGVKFEPKWGSWSTDYHEYEFFRDLDKACCVLTGLRYEDLRRPYTYNDTHTPARTVCDALEDHHRHNTGHWSDEFDSKFFTIRCYKKGTVHLVFKDESLWQRFNQVAAEGKGWLGDGG